MAHGLNPMEVIGFLLVEAAKGSLVALATLGVVVALRRSSSTLRSMVLAHGLSAVLLLFLVSVWLFFSRDFSGAIPHIAVNMDGGLPQGLALPDLGRATWFGRWPQAVILVWLMGVVLHASRLFAGYWNVRRCLVPVTSGALWEAVNANAEALGISHLPRVCLVHRNLSPLVLGWIRPAVVMPESALHWSRAELDRILVHELSHIQRRDTLWGAVAWLARSLWWFNPVVVWAYKRLCLEREQACDDAVLASGCASTDYAGQLIELASALPHPFSDWTPNLTFARRSTLRTRIRSILGAARRTTCVTRPVRSLIVTAFLTSVLGLVAIRGWALEPKSVTDAPPPPYAKPPDRDTLPSPDTFVPIDTEPAILKRTNPVYPDSARKAGQEGTVVLRALVLSTGEVGDVILVRASGHPALDEAACAAMREWEFAPATIKGKAVPVWINYPIKFSLQ